MSSSSGSSTTISVADADLHEAEQRPVAALGHELGVDAEPPLLAGAGGEPLELRHRAPSPSAPSCRAAVIPTDSNSRAAAAVRPCTAASAKRRPRRRNASSRSSSSVRPWPLAARAVRDGDRRDEAEALLAGVALLAERRRRRCPFASCSSSHSPGSQPGLSIVGRAPALERLRQVPLDAGVGALHEVPDRLGVAAPRTSARERRGGGGASARARSACGSNGARATSRASSRSARAAVFAVGTNWRTTRVPRSRARRSASSRSSVPSPRPPAPGWTATSRSPPLDQRVCDERAAVVLHDAGVTLEVDLGRAPLRLARRRPSTSGAPRSAASRARSSSATASASSAVGARSTCPAGIVVSIASDSTFINGTARAVPS